MFPKLIEPETTYSEISDIEQRNAHGSKCLCPASRIKGQRIILSPVLIIWNILNIFKVGSKTIYMSVMFTCMWLTTLEKGTKLSSQVEEEECPV